LTGLPAELRPASTALRSSSVADFSCSPAGALPKPPRLSLAEPPPGVPPRLALVSRLGRAWRSAASCARLITLRQLPYWSASEASWASACLYSACV